MVLALWTRQERTLRRDALILSKEGFAIPLPQDAKLDTFLGFAQRAWARPR